MGESINLNLEGIVAKVLSHEWIYFEIRQKDEGGREYLAYFKMAPPAARVFLRAVEKARPVFGFGELDMVPGMRVMPGYRVVRL